MEQNKKTFAINWPFWQCNAILPNAIGHDIFVWLYLSLLVYLNKADGKSENLASDAQMKKTRELIKAKFSRDLLSDTLINDIEKRVEDEFCNFEGKYQTRVLRDDVQSFLNSFEYLFGNDVEVRNIYKDAVTGAIMPFFDEVELKGEKGGADFSFPQSVLRRKEPAARLVLNALKLEEKAKITADPIAPLEQKESIVGEIEFDENEEIYEDDTIDFAGDVADSAKEESPALVQGTRHKKTITVLEDSYRFVEYMALVYMDDHGELSMDPPDEFPPNPATKAWFNRLFRQALLTNEELKKKIDKVFPKPKEEKKVDPKNMLNLFSEHGSLDKCQELFDVVSHSKMLREYMALEVIRINDNFSSIAGYFHVGRLLDLLGRTIPDEVIRSDSLETYRFNVKEACASLGLSEDDAFKLGGNYIYKEYSRTTKNSKKAPFKALLANAIVNNLACENNPYCYKGVVSDAWYLYGMRSDVDHPNGNVRLTKEDLAKLTRLAKFIVSIQGGKII